MQNDKEKFKMDFQKRLIRFSLRIIKFCNEIRKDKNLWAIADQLIRSATSIGANVIEARACSSKLDYARFFQIALKSANETKYWLILVAESVPNLKAEAKELLDEAVEIANILATGVMTMKGKK